MGQGKLVCSTRGDFEWARLFSSTKIQGEFQDPAYGLGNMPDHRSVQKRDNATAEECTKPRDARNVCNVLP